MAMDKINSGIVSKFDEDVYGLRWINTDDIFPACFRRLRWIDHLKLRSMHMHWMRFLREIDECPFFQIAERHMLIDAAYIEGVGINKLMSGEFEASAVYNIG